jgi:hypothetical protein
VDSYYPYNPEADSLLATIHLTVYRTAKEEVLFWQNKKWHNNLEGGIALRAI